MQRTCEEEEEEAGGNDDDDDDDYDDGFNVEPGCHYCDDVDSNQNNVTSNKVTTNDDDYESNNSRSSNSNDQNNNNGGGGGGDDDDDDSRPDRNHSQQQQRRQQRQGQRKNKRRRSANISLRAQNEQLDQVIHGLTLRRQGGVKEDEAAATAVVIAARERKARTKAKTTGTTPVVGTATSGREGAEADEEYPVVVVTKNIVVWGEDGREGGVRGTGDAGGREGGVEVPHEEWGGYDDENRGESGAAGSHGISAVCSRNCEDGPPAPPSSSHTDSVVGGFGDDGVGVGGIGSGGGGGGDVGVSADGLSKFVMRICGEESAGQTGTVQKPPNSSGPGPLAHGGVNFNHDNNETTSTTSTTTNTNNHDKSRRRAGTDKQTRQRTRSVAMTTAAVTPASINATKPAETTRTRFPAGEDALPPPTTAPTTKKVKVRNSVLGGREGGGMARREQRLMRLLPAERYGPARAPGATAVAPGRKMMTRVKYVPPVAGKDVVEKQKKYGLGDRYLRYHGVRSQ